MSIDPTLCRGPECTRPIKARGMCTAHYQQSRKPGFVELTPLRSWARRPDALCGVDDCDRPLHGARYCQTHQRHAREGKPLGPIRREPLQRICDFPDCGRPHNSHGLCVSHSQQKARGQELRPIGWKPPKTTCTGPSCDKPAKTRGLCDGHYRQHRTGRELVPLGARRAAAQQPGPCTTDGCDRRIKYPSLGLCRRCYQRHIAAGGRTDRPTPIRPAKPRKPAAKKADPHPSNLPPGWFKPTLRKRKQDPLDQPRDTTDRTLHVDFNIPELPRELRRKAARRARLMGAADLIPMLGLEDVA